MCRFESRRHKGAACCNNLKPEHDEEHWQGKTKVSLRHISNLNCDDAGQIVPEWLVSLQLAAAIGSGLLVVIVLAGRSQSDSASGSTRTRNSKFNLNVNISRVTLRVSITGMH